MSNLLMGVQVATGLLNAGLEYLLVVQRWNAVVATAQAEGRDITDAELEAFKDMADAAENRLQRAIDGVGDVELIDDPPELTLKKPPDSQVESE